MRVNFKELEQKAPGLLQRSPGFEYVFLPFGGFNADAIRAEKPGESLKFSFTGDHIVLTFHTHAWSGTANLVLNGTQFDWPVYSAEHGFSACKISSNGNARVDVEIRSGTSRPEGSKGDQVWLALVEFSDVQDWQKAP